METMTKRVMRGALLLTIAGLITKVLSALYRIPLQNMTGDIGFYNYQQIYPIIGTVMILALYGFPVAVSKLTAERTEKKKPITYTNFYLPLFFILLSINSVIFFSIFFAAPFIASWIGDSQLKTAYQFAAFLFLLIPFLSLLRGTSQGREEMKQTAISQVLEQTFRVAILITAAFIIFTGKMDVYRIGEAGVFATLTGMLAAIIFLVVYARRHSKKKKQDMDREIPWRYYLYTCLSLGMLASLNHLILILIQFADVLTLVPNLIDYGLTPIQAMETKGVFDRAQPLIQFGVVFGSSFALALLPAVVRERKNVEKKSLYTSISEALVFSIYISVGATLGLMIILPETNILLFMNADGSGSMRILVLSIVFTAVSITGCAILQGIGQLRQPAIWIILAFFIKLGLNLLLVPIWGIYGSAFASVISVMMLFFMILRILHKKLPGLTFVTSVKWRALLIASGGMGVYLIFMKIIFSSLFEASRYIMIWYVPFLVGTGAIIYLLLLLRYEAFTRNQLEALPFSTIFMEVERLVVKK